MLTLVFAQEISMDHLETGGPVQLQNTPITHISFEHPIKLMEDDNFSSKPKSKDTQFTGTRGPKVQETKKQHLRTSRTIPHYNNWVFIETCVFAV